MANFLKGIEEKATLVLANVCIAFVVLARYSPETSRLYLMITATALGLLSLYPLFLILQRPRRFMVARETEGDKSVFILRYKGFLWWYNATDRKGEDIVFNTMDEAQRYIRENVVTVLISDRMRRKSFKKEYEVVLDSKKMAANTDAPPADDNQQQKQDSPPTGDNEHVQQQKQETSPTPRQDGPKQDAQQHEEDEREEIIPDNAAAIAGLLAMGKESQDEDDDKEDEGKEKRSKDAEPNRNKGTEPPKQQLSGPTADNAPPESGTETEKQQQDGDVKKDEKKEEDEEQDYLNDPFDSRYPAPEDDADGDNNPPEDGQDNNPDGQVDTIDAETLNQRLFDVIDNFNKSANQRKAAKKPEKQPPAPMEEPPESEPQKPYVTTAQAYEEQALVHAHKAETVKDALSKILFHQQMMEKNEEREKDKENKPASAPTPTHQKAQAIPKSRRRKNRSPDGIPTKNIQYRPSSEELLLRRRQMSLLEVPGFIDPEEEVKTDTTEQPDASQPGTVTAQNQSEPKADATENDGSSGGPKIVKRMECGGNETTPSSAAVADAMPVPDNTMTETPNVVFINGSEDKAEEPPDNENATLPL